MQSDGQTPMSLTARYSTHVRVYTTSASPASPVPMAAPAPPSGRPRPRHAPVSLPGRRPRAAARLLRSRTAAEAGTWPPAAAAAPDGRDGNYSGRGAGRESAPGGRHGNYSGCSRRERRQRLAADMETTAAAARGGRAHLAADTGTTVAAVWWGSGDSAWRQTRELKRRVAPGGDAAGRYDTQVELSHESRGLHGSRGSTSRTEPEPPEVACTYRWRPLSRGEMVWVCRENTAWASQYRASWFLHIAKCEAE